ncbi:ABC transporter permease [Microbacterium marinilacus]|uniref:ABC transporter permease n=1 Tax=Microbacterium marinilacus TaxID=415209 RepID=A0ABP7BR36_9MICO|nr:ABC transporter permease [Microbacterium marinilacus]MBY0690249.1 ABC transporter permease [Microbacterium marinilacus]
MLTVIGKRALAAIPTLLGVTAVVFLILRLVPGDPVTAMLQGSPATTERIQELREQFGLERPLLVQYLAFLVGLVRGDLGTSYATRQDVTAMIAQQLLPTLELALAAALFTAVVGIALGAVAAAFPRSPADAAIRVFSLLGTSMPAFWIGLMLIMVVSFQLRLLPATGTGGIERLILPAVALGMSAAGVVGRLVRNNMLEVMGENFVSALVAKGVPRRVVLVKHVLRNAVSPAITILGLQIGALLAGAVIVESVFARQGLGHLLTQAIATSDFPVIQGIVLVIAVIYIAVNVVVDVSYAIVDPRVRPSSAASR